MRRNQKRLNKKLERYKMLGNMYNEEKQVFICSICNHELKMVKKMVGHYEMHETEISLSHVQRIDDKYVC